MTAAPTSSTADWRRIDLAHHLHPFTDYKAFAAEGGSRIIRRAEGVHLWDSDGNRILDGMSGLWCVNVGYGRPELAEAAGRQILDLAYYNTFFKTANEPAIALAQRLARLAPPGLDRAFFTNSGSEANDTIIRLVRHYWNLMGRPAKKTIISREWAYHGSTLATVAMGGMAAMHDQGDPPPSGFAHVPPPYWYGYGGDMTPEDFGRHAARAVESRILELGADTVAAFIGEPIQGAGGVIIPPATYWPEIQRICREHDILLIVDEVVSGFGRLGRWFGSDLYGVTPDLMTLAKGLTSGYLPLAAVMVGDRVAEALIERGGEFCHGFTYSGHPTPCAVALANLDVLDRENLVERVGQDIGPYFQRRLREALADHPLVGEVRGVGLIAGIELVADKATRTFFRQRGAIGSRCRDHAVAHGLIMRATRDTMLLAPPFIITEEQVEELVTKAGQAIDAVARELGRL